MISGAMSTMRSTVDAGGTAAAVALLGPHRDFVPRKGQLSWHITFVTPDYLAH